MAKRAPSFRSGPSDVAARKWGVTNRLSASARGYGTAWQRLRAEILARDKGLCQMCLADGRAVVARDVDHIVPKHRGGSDEAGNLQSLCVPCHQAKTAREGQTARG